jgi:hypothetical protein
MHQSSAMCPNETLEVRFEEKELSSLLGIDGELVVQEFIDEVFDGVAYKASIRTRQ